VPTPQTVVEKMLKMAKVGKDDVVYDLGCGDGRIVVAAVSKFGAKKGVGIDLDPKRIKESNENAKEAGVEDKIEFRKGDVTKVTDLENATVVCLYLSDDLNELLRPILQKRLKPGTRIVSHRFLMGDWKPEKTETVTVGGSRYLVHLWTIEDKEKPKKDKDKEDDKDKDKEDKDKAKKDKDEDKDKKEDKKDKDKGDKDKKDKDEPKKDKDKKEDKE
jgi:SAM-dependent methyltransferase